MSDKPKRKSDETIPHRYWWIFATLAIVLLIGLRFPVKILYWWGLNPFLYGLIAVLCLITIFRFIRRYHWKHILVGLMLVCIFLAGWQTYIAKFWGDIRDSRAECSVEHHYIISITKCRVGGSLGGSYISFRYIPIGIEYDTWTNL